MKLELFEDRLSQIVKESGIRGIEKENTPTKYVDFQLTNGYDDDNKKTMHVQVLGKDGFTYRVTDYHYNALMAKAIMILRRYVKICKTVDVEGE